MAMKENINRSADKREKLEKEGKKSSWKDYDCTQSLGMEASHLTIRLRGWLLNMQGSDFVDEAR